MIVRLRQRSSRYPDLSPRQPYVVIGIEADQFRILNDAGRPYLYPPRLFACIDSREPDDWVEERGDDGERYVRSEEHTSELQSLAYLVCRLLLEKKKRI